MTTQIPMNEKILKNALGETEYRAYIRGESQKTRDEVQTIYQSYLAQVKQIVEDENELTDDANFSQSLNIRVSSKMKILLEVHARAQGSNIADVVRESVNFYLEQYELELYRDATKQDIVDLQKEFQSELQAQYHQLVEEMREMFAFTSYAQSLLITAVGINAAEHQLLLGMKDGDLEKPSQLVKKVININSHQYHGLFDALQYSSRQMWLPHIADNKFRHPLRGARIVKKTIEGETEQGDE